MKDFFEKHPVLYGVGVTVALFLVLHELAPRILLGIYNIIPVNVGILYLVLVALALAACIIHNKMHEKDGYKGVFSFGKSKQLFVYLLIAILLLHKLSTVLPDLIKNTGTVGLPTFSTFCIALQAGVTEEAMFRAIPIALMMYMAKDSKRIYAAMIISALFFGCSHFYNIIAGAALNTTLIQVASCISSGFIYAAIYLRTGSIIPCMVYHFGEDIIGTMLVSNATGLMTESIFTFETYIGVALLAIVEIAIGLFLVRKVKREEILQTWADKWAK